MKRARTNFYRLSAKPFEHAKPGEATINNYQMKKTNLTLLVMLNCFITACNHKKGIVVFQTDFGLKD